MKLFKSFNRAIMTIFLFIICLGLVQCGSGVSTSASSSTPTPSSGQTQAVYATKAAVGTTSGLSETMEGLLGNLPGLQFVTVGPTNCTAGGTQTYTFESSSTSISLSITYANCDYGYGYSFNGTASLSGTLGSGGDVSGTITFSNYSYTEDSETMTLSGSVTMAYTASTDTSGLTFDVTGTDESNNSATLTGSISIDSSGKATGQLTVTVTLSTGESYTFTCTFSSFDLSTATDSDWLSACTAN